MATLAFRQLSFRSAVVYGLLSLWPKAACSEECHFHYWEVIPHSSTCETYYLPDFEFRKIAHGSSESGTDSFCSRYQISSKFAKQVSGYCYTGLGERIGPTFRLGDENWNPSRKEKDRVYFADLNFSGCVRGKKAEGIVFGIFGWRGAPSEIERSWRMQGRLASCER